MSIINLLNFDRKSMREYFLKLGEKSFRADQVFQWIHYYGYKNFDNMSNLSKTFRKYLSENACIVTPQIVREQKSKDETIKWLMKLEDNQYIETVFIPETDRGTLCISSQVGCALNCSFCRTGQFGFKRNLDISEIIGQLWQAVRYLSKERSKHDHRITNVVMMGMGEPLLNLENVVKATNIMMDDLAYGLSKYRVTISTSGIVPVIYQLSKLSDASLAVSLHAPNDEIRNKIMPINKKYPLKELIKTCKKFFDKKTKRKISFEYIMLKNFNDKPEHARELIKLLKNVPCKVNLIPYNNVKGINYESSDKDSIETFQNILLKAGIRTNVRKERGSDINAACGQLAVSRVRN